MKLFFTSLFFILSALNSRSQILAFPGAEGAGKNTTGGRGSIASPPTIYVVNTLSDANVVGTLRYAATHVGPLSRIIIFKVAGTIHLTSALKFSVANTTIAGQTAPGQGICLADYPVQVNANNVIVRYIRFRMGDKNQNPTGTFTVGSGNDDAFDDASHNHNHIIIDHCTMSWSDDEACTFYGGDSLTLQWNIISEPLNYSYHLESGDLDYEHHGYGGIWGGQHASFHHNLFAHCQGRVPRFDGVRNLGAVVGNENADFRNNVLYDWGGYDTNGGEGGNYNIINNFYKWGPSTSIGSSSGVKITSEIVNPYKQTSAPILPYGKYYMDGNFVDSLPGIPSVNTTDNWHGAAMSGGSYADTSSAKVTVPFVMTPVATQLPAAAYTSVLTSAGCSLPGRDTLDQRIVKNVINRTGKIIDVQGDYPHGTAYALTVNAWPTLDQGFTPVDTDGDGMPDVWETQRGLNPNNSTDFNGYTSTSGYPNIENFINGDTILAQGILNTCVTTKMITATNSGNWLFANDTTYSTYSSPSYLSSTDSNNVAASILDNGSFGNFTVSYYTTNTTRFDAFSHPYLNRNITITPATPAVITSPVMVRIYFSKAEYNALRDADFSINSLADLRIIKVATNICPSAFTGPAQIITPSAYGTFGTYQTGYYLEFSTSSFSTFFVTSAVSAIPLPLNIISFNGSFDAGIAKLNWITENEINMKNYVIERSANGRAFDSTGIVAAFNLRVTNNYSFKDLNPLPGVSYYRLKMVDVDGYSRYSNTIAINNRHFSALSIFPNPVENTVKISYPKASGESFISILGSDGKLLIKSSIVTGTTTSELNFSSFQSGIYILLYNDNKQTQTIKFIKK